MLTIPSLLLILNIFNHEFRENRILRNYIIVNPTKNENENLEDSGIELEYIKNERENKRLISKHSFISLSYNEFRYFKKP